MKFFAINGSHRKDGNTAQLLEKALEGIQSVCSDAEIESVNLYDIPFNGCKSCFACVLCSLRAVLQRFCNRCLLLHIHR